MNHYGLGTEKNMFEAFRWYEKAALHNMKEAQFNLAKLLLRVRVPIMIWIDQLRIIF
jgi:TPR repeat protein